jgi:ribosomal protein L7/L12
MNNINLSLTLKSALSLLTNNSISDTIRDEIQKSIEVAMSQCGCGVNSTHNMNLTLKSVPVKEKVRCIAAVRNTLLWGLKDSKDFVDVVLGKLDLESTGIESYDSAGYWSPVYKGGTPNTLTETTERVRKLAAQLTEMGCEVYTDTYNCT